MNAPSISHTCCIVGGGPAGMIAGWLLARAGVDVVVLEKHADFNRDFRGDTIHPSTLELMHELGVLDRFLAIPHQRITELELEVDGARVHGPDFRRVPTHCQFVALMPQADFLEFVYWQARVHAGFHLLMGAQVESLIEADGRVAGVVATTARGRVEIRADLVIGADGRHSAVRAAAGLVPRELGSPIDVLWMRLPRRPDDDALFGRLRAGRFLVMLDRGDYWQCAYPIPKGSIDHLRARGLDALRAELVAVAPFLTDRVRAIASWDDVKLLTVTIDRLERWSRPGLLCIGDAAHAMSPVGGVGINLAIQDAVATANLLWQPLRDRRVTMRDLARVQRRRARATRWTQRIQQALQDRIIADVAVGRRPRPLDRFTWALDHLPALRTLLARALGVGFRLEHLASPELSAA